MQVAAKLPRSWKWSWTSAPHSAASATEQSILPQADLQGGSEDGWLTEKCGTFSADGQRSEGGGKWWNGKRVDFGVRRPGIES